MQQYYELNANVRYVYYAFISYRRTDAKWAEWLQDKLQSFHLPTRLCRKYPMLPARLSPVFLDKKNLTAGELEECLKKELEVSKYLIVICSRKALEKPYYLNKEISLFLETGHSPEQIIPFIVDDAPHPETECFPPELQTICQNASLLGVNIFDAGERSAFLKVVAYMHGLRLTELESAEDRRLKRRRRNLAIVISMIVIVLASVGYYLWDYYVPKVGYYLDYTTKNGLPVGIHALKGEQRAETGDWYRIKSWGDYRYELRHENSMGHLEDHPEGDFVGRPTMAVYECVNGKLDRVIYYNKNEKPEMEMEYWTGTNDRVATVMLRAVGTELVNNVHLNSNMLSMIGNSWKLFSIMQDQINKSAITRYLYDLDENGYITMVRYAKDGNYAVADENGIYGIKYELDDMGRVLKQYFLTLDEETVKADNVQKYTQRNAGMCSKEFRYDEKDRLTDIICYDMNDEPILNEQGWMICRFIYSEDKNIYCAKRVEYLNATGKLMQNELLYAAVENHYNEKSQLCEQYYFGTNGKATYTNSGVMTRIQYDSNGYINGLWKLTPDGSPLVYDEDFVSGSWDFNDDHGNLLIRTTRNAYNELTPDENGVCIALYKYLDDGRIELVQYMDQNEKPVRSAQGMAAIKYQYEDQQTVIFFLDEDLMPVENNEGVAGVVQIFNDQGNLSKTFCFGLDNKPRRASDGSYGSEYTYDDSGHCCSIVPLGADLKPTVLPSGAARAVMTFDSRHGRLSMIEQLDEHGNRCNGSTGIAAEIYEYNKYGNPTRSYFVDAEGNLVFQEDMQCALVEREYDGSCLIREKFYDADGKPITLLEINDQGEVVRQVYYMPPDESDEQNPDAMAYTVFEYYDPQNQYDPVRQEMTVYDAAGKPQVGLMVDKDGVEYKIGYKETEEGEFLKHMIRNEGEKEVIVSVDRVRKEDLHVY